MGAYVITRAGPFNKEGGEATVAIFDFDGATGLMGRQTDFFVAFRQRFNYFILLIGCLRHDVRGNVEKILEMTTELRCVGF